MNEHSACLPSEHVTCRVCQKPICLSVLSDHRADMYRLTPIHPDCRIPPCPSCKRTGTLHWVERGSYVECLNKDCKSTFNGTDSALIKATIESCL